MSSRRPVGMQAPYTAIDRITQDRFELAFDRTHPEKTALDCDARRHFAAKSRSTKSLTLSQGVETIGVEPLPPRLVNWQSDIRASVSQSLMRTARKYSAGTREGPPYGRHGKYG